MRLSGLIIFLVSSFVVSCSQADKKQVKDAQVISSPAIIDENLSLKQLDERLTEADSLVFIFYKDPQGKDSLRYTRFYKQYATVDTALIAFVKANLSDRTTRFERIIKCRSEGKIWCFKKGEIFQTIYFSSFSTDCSFLYIIKHGQFYYSSISAEMSAKLRKLRTVAIEPSK